MPAYASVVLIEAALTHSDRTFTYAVPDDVAVGAIVRVPFHGRRRTGVVVDVFAEPDVPRVVPIVGALGPGIGRELVDLARWTAERYLSSLGEALAAVIPDRIASEEEQAAVSATAPDDVRALDPFVTYRNGDALLRALRAGPAAGFVWRPRFDEPRGETIAAFARETLERGRGVIVLVPEIRVRGEVATALRRVFGDGVAWLSSDRAPRSRYRDWLALRTGTKRLAVGGRAAVFAPVQRLGLIVIDDEAHASYKAGRAPRFHARTVAAERARREGATLVLAGVPPSVEARAAVERGPYTLVATPRDEERSLRPPVTVVAREPGERLVPSSRTLTMVRETLASGARAILLTHRGGDALAATAERAERITRARAAARLDAGAGVTALQQAARGADLIVATPFIAKDLRIAGVGVLAIVDADAALAQPEFRAQEEAFGTWWHAARWVAGGRVLIETTDARQAAIVALTRWDPDVLYRADAALRKDVGYPPFAILARVDVPPERAADVADTLSRAAGDDVVVLGPVEREGSAVVVLRARRRERLLAFLAPIAAGWRERNEPMRIDVDPWEVLVPKWRS